MMAAASADAPCCEGHEKIERGQDRRKDSFTAASQQRERSCAHMVVQVKPTLNY